MRGAYAVLWLTGVLRTKTGIPVLGRAATVNAVIQPGTNAVATYRLGFVDPAVGDEATMPLFHDAHAAMVWMLDHAGCRALVAVPVVRQLRHGDRFAPPEAVTP